MTKKDLTVANLMMGKMNFCFLALMKSADMALHLKIFIDLLEYSVLFQVVGLRILWQRIVLR